jgi:hypothetical protein
MSCGIDTGSIGVAEATTHLYIGLRTTRPAPSTPSVPLLRPGRRCRKRRRPHTARARDGVRGSGALHAGVRQRERVRLSGLSPRAFQLNARPVACGRTITRSPTVPWPGAGISVGGALAARFCAITCHAPRRGAPTCRRLPQARRRDFRVGLSPVTRRARSPGRRRRRSGRRERPSSPVWARGSPPRRPSGRWQSLRAFGRGSGRGSAWRRRSGQGTR